MFLLEPLVSSKDVRVLVAPAFEPKAKHLDFGAETDQEARRHEADSEALQTSLLSRRLVRRRF